MKCKVFYSWQSDLPNATNRSFILDALEKAAKAIRDDDSIQVEPVVDRDTAGVPGSPDIASTILDKIDHSQIIVCDVSIINQGTQERPTPNPNVLIELGYAIKSLGVQHVVMVMNTAFGGPELLPFDLRMKRVVTYHAPEEGGDRATERRKLSAILEDALRAILVELDKQKPGQIGQAINFGERARTAIENGQPNQVAEVRRFMSWLMDEIDELSPAFPGSPEDSDTFGLLRASINSTQDLVGDFAHVAEMVAIMHAADAAQEIYKGFENILDRHNTPPDFSGSYQTTRQDFYKFIGHELFVTFFSFLIQENRWGVVVDLLEGGLFVENGPRGIPEFLPFETVSRTVESLKGHNNYVHADILNERHTVGELSVTIPMQQFISADCFLFLKSGSDWQPWSVAYIKKFTPRYLIEATNLNYAQKLLRPFGVTSVELLREHLDKRTQEMQRSFGYPMGFRPLANFNPQIIGSH